MPRYSLICLLATALGALWLVNNEPAGWWFPVLGVTCALPGTILLNLLGLDCDG